MASEKQPNESVKKVKRNPKDFEHLLKRDHTLKSGIVIGIDGHIIEIQARATSVLSTPAPHANVTRISGMPKGAIKEVLQRIHGAFTKYGIPNSDVEILINLAPAGLPKEGTWLDLPIAIIMLQASGYLRDLPPELENSFVILGEIGIHGELRRVPGVLSIAFEAGSRMRIIVPDGNQKECFYVRLKPGCEECNAYPVKTLLEVIEYFQGKRTLSGASQEKIDFESVIPKATDFGVIKGQQRAKEAALICAVGGHNLLMIGPPGEGKSLLASAIPGILPDLTNAEKAELTRIYSACGLLDRDALVVTRRPVRTINNTATVQSVVGGGKGVPSPGEITLAHLGILFMDELPEFSRGTIDALRQPLESGTITISRSEMSLEFPARFTLVAAMNPCPCGFYGYGNCSCKESDIRKYQKKISGPILDRIDLQVELTQLSLEERFSETNEIQTGRCRMIVQMARNRQNRRFEGTTISHNATIPTGRMRELCHFSDRAFEHYKNIVAQNNISTRSVDRLARVSRTVADIDDFDFIEPEHVDKAASFVIGGILRDMMK